MSERITSDRAARIGALIAATLLHLPLMFATRSRDRVEARTPALLVRFIDVAPTRAEAPKRGLQANEAIRRTPALSSARRAGSSAPADVPTSEAPDGPVRNDWYLRSEIASRAAIDAIIAEEAYRSLGPREKRHQIIEPKPPPPLFAQPKRRPGDIAPNSMGYVSVWHSDHCFTQLEQPIIPNLPKGPGDSSPVPVTCLFPLGEPEPRGDLFEHLKKDRDKAPLPGETPRPQ